MLPSDKLGRFAIIVVTHLTNLTTCDTEPDMIRLVFTLDPFTVLGVCLNDDSVVPLTHDSSDVCSFLTFEVFTYESFERGTCNLDVDCLLRILVRSDCKEFQRLWVWCPIENAPFEVPPWKVRVRIDTLFTFVRPEHPKARTTVDARVDTLTPFGVIW